MGFCNTYLIGPHDGGDAILVDPGQVDNTIITLIEKNKYNVKTILLTHRHESHSNGVKTLLKIYNPTVFAFTDTVYDFPVESLEHKIYDSETIEEKPYKFNCGEIEIETIHVPGHCIDSIVYKIGHALFTGDTLLATHIGSTPGYMERDLLIKSIKQKIMTLDDHLIIFPGHGAPSTIKCERIFNIDLNEDLASPWMKKQIMLDKKNRF